MAQVIKLKRSAVSGKTPQTSSLQLGELAVNTTDGKIYTPFRWWHLKIV